MNPYQHLLYCRQFILCEKEISDFQTWNIYTIDRFKLYVHPKLNVSTAKKDEKELYLLGDLYDYNYRTISNDGILERLIVSDSIHELTRKCENYAGRFILIFKKNKSIKIFNDAAASRKIYYYIEGDTFCCATQPHVIAKYFDVRRSKKTEILEFYQSQEFYAHNKVGIMNKTIYDPIKLLQANYYIDINRREIKRFWPHQKLQTISFNEGIEKASSTLKGLMKNIHFRNKIMMAITGGNDSRLLLSASREIADDIFLYIFHLPGMKNCSHPDLAIHKKITAMIGNEGYIVDYNTEIDNDFKEIFFKNNEFPEEANLPIIYNFMYKKCSDKLNVATTLNDMTRCFFNTFRKKIDARLLAIINGYQGIQYVIEEYRKWLIKTKPVLDNYGYNILDIFKQEERISNWSAYYVSDSDIAIDEVSPFTCRKLFETILSVPRKYRDVNTNIFNRAMINKMWPEIGKLPYNPFLKNKICYTMKKTRLYWPVRRVIKGW